MKCPKTYWREGGDFQVSQSLIWRLCLPSNCFWSRWAARRSSRQHSRARARRGTRAAAGCGEGRRCAVGRSWAGSWWRPCRCRQSVRGGARSRWGCGTSWTDSRTGCWRCPWSVLCRGRMVTRVQNGLLQDLHKFFQLPKLPPLPHRFSFSDPLLDDCLRRRIPVDLSVDKCKESKWQASLEQSQKVNKQLSHRRQLNHWDFSSKVSTSCQVAKECIFSQS